MQIPAHQIEFDLPQADDIRINDPALITRVAAMQSSSSDVRLSALRTEGGPVFNCRSEGRRFADSKRCLMPAPFFEFTGTK
ncbi:hypothetical protein LB553_25970 [Mesorhizobium sp. CA8]|uniref:hypothetical protein n=1 Tax=unclassified Mesorhizobium TaxID=325217 RepID=UPI001CCC0020|nr:MULTISPECIES: hypothetical protein [unclassified Mesorhizobium]MBZ9764295.1 hypothetical protein [Mesorhizobium sp. CA8]MBZ9822017.1 hypothetical protein [Mesorhizobium sp. CA4]